MHACEQAYEVLLVFIGSSYDLIMCYYSFRLINTIVCCAALSSNPKFKASPRACPLTMIDLPPALYAHENFTQPHHTPATCSIPSSRRSSLARLYTYHPHHSRHSENPTESFAPRTSRRVQQTPCQMYVRQYHHADACILREAFINMQSQVKRTVKLVTEQHITYMVIPLGASQAVLTSS